MTFNDTKFMDKVSTRHIKLTIMLAMLMFTGAAMAQRTGDPEPDPPVANTKVLVEGSVFGGGNLAAVGGNTSVTINQTGSQVETDVYGGGALADVGTNLSNTTTVTITNGKVIGDVYGGGLGNNTTPAMVKGNVTVVVGAGSVSVGGSVFGCNNVNGTPLGTVTVTINGSAESTGTGASKVYAIGGVYGGGNLAHYDPTTPDSYPTVTVNGCTTSIKDVYGGGNAAAVPYTSVTINGGDIDRVFAGGNGASRTPAHVGWKNTEDDPTSTSDNYGAGTALATIHGGTINQVFSGSNANGVIRETMGVSVSKVGSCAIQVGELYGGGNEAPSQPGSISVGCMDENDMIDNLYGGANQADISGDIELNIETGRIGNVFGGNNTSGAISGTITVNINKNNSATCAEHWYVGNVYGGGNHAPYTSTPDVNIINGTVSGSVYGGGNEAGVGGGNVAMTGGAVLGGLYGGCNTSGVVGGDITVNITGGTIGADETHRADVFGGGYGDGTSTTGSVTVNFGGTPESFPSDHNEFPKIFGDIYGGSALGSVNHTDGSKATIVNVLNGTLVSDVGTDANGFPVYNGGNVFGGGLGLAGDATKGKVNGTVTVNIGTGTLSGSYTTDTSGEAIIKGNVYGCNNTNGSPQQNVTVNIYHTAHTANDSATYVGTTPSELKYALQNVFGGGNQANFRVTGKTATVNIYGCDNTISRTFGGGNAAATNTVMTMIQGGRINEAFAGGNGEVSEANIYGNATLAIHGGNIGMSFNGSNQNGQITGTASTTIDEEGGCGEVQIEEHFCGSNFSDWYGDIVAPIECPGMHVKNLYGGCKQAKVLKYPTAEEIRSHLNDGFYPDFLINLYNEHESTWDTDYAGKGGNIHLTVTGGVYENIYGGSQGKIDPANSANNISADIAGHILLEIYGGTVSNAVYGGSHILGRVGGTITVNIEDTIHTGDCALDLSVADIYGGGNMADYTTPNVSGYPETHDFPHVNIKNATVKNVFGGGLAAEVKGNPQIRIKKGAKVLGNVYGGGNMGEVKDNTATTEVQEGNPRVIINGKDESDNPTGNAVLYPGYNLPDLPSEP